MKLFKQIQQSGACASLLMVWVVVACMVPNLWMAFSEGMAVVQSITNVLLPLALYIALMSITARVGRASLWMIILFIFAGFQIVLLFMFGRAPIAVDMFLNVATTNPGEVGELLGNLWVVLFGMIIIYIPAIIMAIVAVVRRWRLSAGWLKKSRRTALIVAILGAITFGGSFFCSRPYSPHKDIYPVNVIYNLYLAIQRTVRVANYHDTSAAFTYHASSEHPDSVPEVYVLVVGETSRACNWQIAGYDRPTTPLLMNRDGLVSFPRALSQSNTTHKSVPMLMSTLDATTFGDSIYTTKSIITAFKEAGFHTAYFSNQSRNHSFIDFFGEEADTCVFIKEADKSVDQHLDDHLLPYLDGQLAAGHNKLLVVLHTYGSHFNYIDRYPAEMAQFGPDRPARATKEYRDKQINAYDNTILYTSTLLSQIIDRLDATNGVAAMIYTSDHGEDIFDDERNLFLHASPNPSYYQIHVPFLVWLSNEYHAAHPDVISTLKSNSTKFVPSSRAFAQTALQMAGIATPYRADTASVASPSFTPGAPIYLNDHNEAVSLERSGLLQPDFDRLKALNL